MDRQFDAYNRHDLAAFADAYSDDIIMWTFGDTVVIASSDSLRQLYGSLFARQPHIHAERLARIAVGPFVIDHERLTGIANGATYCALALYEVHGSHIRRATATAMKDDTAHTSTDGPAVVGRRLHDAINRHDLDAAASLFADTVIYHELGDTSVITMSRADRRTTYAQVGAKNPHFKHLIVQQFVVGPYLAMQERLTSMADGKIHDALDVIEVQHGQVVREWESRW